MSDKYQIRISDRANASIRGIGYYIANNLCAPGTASAVMQRIESAIMSLDQLPNRYPLVDTDVSSQKGVRRMLVRKNYIVYYLVDNQNRIVHILAVTYARSDQTDVLP